MTAWDEFQKLVRARRATRAFKPDPVPDSLLHDLLDTTRWAPSGYNLQPTHFVLVTDPHLRPALCQACLNQKQILEAPATVVFAADRDVAKHHLDAVLEADRQAGAVDDAYEKRVRKYVGLAFGQGPVGVGWLMKLVAAPVMRIFAPTPSIPAVHKRYWLAKQAMLSAMTFMLAAQAAGLATCPMEGFDEIRVRRALKIPSRFIVCLVVPVGYAADGPLTKSRLSLDRLLHVNRS